jgi:hypothetical protein
MCYQRLVRACVLMAVNMDANVNAHLEESRDTFEESKYKAIVSAEGGSVACA